MLMGLTIFGGSLEFVGKKFDAPAPFAPLQTFLVALMLPGPPPVLRHCHAGKVPGLGLKRYYLIFGMCRREL